jgi:hypothetical protein
MTLRERIKARKRDAPPVQPVATPEWPDDDGKFFVRKVSAREVDGIYARAEPGNNRAHYVAVYACDENGIRLFNDEDAAWLADEPDSVIDRISQAGMSFNRQSAAAKADLKKNSPSGKEGGDSPTS